MRLLGWRLAGLVHPQWTLRLGPEGATPRAVDHPEGLHVEGQVFRLLGAGGEARPIRVLDRCRLEGARVAETTIGTVEACLARGSHWHRVQVDRLLLSELDGAHLVAVRVGEVANTSLRGAALEDVVLDRVVLSDLAGARLRGVRLGAAPFVDLTEAVLEGCDLAGADLRGARMRRVRLAGTSLAGARVEGADLRGARGLDPATRQDLLARGAVFRAPGWYGLVRRLLPRLGLVGAERLAAAVEGLSLGLGALLAFLALWGVLRPPPVKPIPEIPAALPRAATEAEVAEARAHLLQLRGRLQAVHEEMLGRGARQQTWPSMADFQENRYDLDGDGPGEVRANLFPGGLPGNPLTDAQGGALPYCNDTPTPETLSGVETDWHYCDRTGRVLPSAGVTGVDTAGW